MSMTKEKQFNGYIDLSDMKPEISKNGIFFPVSVKHEDLDKYNGDARSFGYHYDDGYCSIVKYEQVVGTLADDTIEIFDDCNTLKKHMQKPHHSSLEIVDDDKTMDKNNAELLIRYDSEYFYRDEHGYFFITEYFDNGTPQRVTNESAEIYREVNKEYQRQIVKHNSAMKQALENIELLRETL